MLEQKIITFLVLKAYSFSFSNSNTVKHKPRTDAAPIAPIPVCFTKCMFWPITLSQAYIKQISRGKNEVSQGRICFSI
jgi:hypothetical protein